MSTSEKLKNKITELMTKISSLNVKNTKDSTEKEVAEEIIISAPLLNTKINEQEKDTNSTAIEQTPISSTSIKETWDRLL